MFGLAMTEFVSRLPVRTSGFKPKASEKTRSAAIQKLQKAIQGNPKLLDGTTAPPEKK